MSSSCLTHHDLNYLDLQGIYLNLSVIHSAEWPKVKNHPKSEEVGFLQNIFTHTRRDGVKLLQHVSLSKLLLEMCLAKTYGREALYRIIIATAYDSLR